MAGAQTAAHRQGVVHRDIKPANILLDEEGNSYLTDFGIAKDLSDEAQLTATGAVVGTLDYISPEQILNEDLTGRADIYSLGAVLYETLTGEKPFPDSFVANLIHKHLKEPVPLVSASRPDVPVQSRRGYPAGHSQASGRPLRRRPGDGRGFPGSHSPAWALDVVTRDGAGSRRSTIPTRGCGPSRRPTPTIFTAGKRWWTNLSLISRLKRGNRASWPWSVQAAAASPARSKPDSSRPCARARSRPRAMPGSDKWFMAEMAPGTHPLEELELALWPIAVDPPPSLVEPMQRDTSAVCCAPSAASCLDEEGAQLLLVIDQFEELFTLVDDEERRDFFVDSLLAAVSATRAAR